MRSLVYPQRVVLIHVTGKIVSLTLKVGFELIQVRNGASVGRPTARGITPTGTLEALNRELADTWAKMRGKEGDIVRKNMENVGEVLRASWREGESRKAMRGLERFF